MIHYHVTPITPREKLLLLAGRNFCISLSDPRDLDICLEIGQALMFDNGAFSAWRKGNLFGADEFYKWIEPVLSPPHWGVVPDVIEGTEKENDDLLRSWPFSKNLAGVVWHMNESLDRLERLSKDWPRVCIGSTKEYALHTSAHLKKLTEAFDRLRSARTLGETWIHGLRMMALSGKPFPFSSADSSNVAQNHSRETNNVIALAGRWDVVQCPLPK